MKKIMLILGVMQFIAVFSMASDVNDLNQQLVRAVRHDNVDQARNAIEQGANVNALDSYRSVPLLHATSSEMAHLLIDSGANLDLMYAGNRLLVFLMQMGKLNIAKALIDRGADINFLVDGHSFLKYAAVRSDQEVVDALLKKGVDVNVKDQEGKTLLHDIIDPTIIRMLVNAGADINARDARGLTPLHYVALKFEPKAAATLLSLGANSQARDRFNRTPWDYLKRDKKDNFIKQIIKNYYDPNLKPLVWRRWNFPQTSLSLREVSLKKMYEDYLNGTSNVLQELLSDPNVPVSIQAPFTNSFIQKIKGLSSEDIAQQTVEKFATKKAEKKHSEKLKSEVQSLIELQECERTQCSLEQEREMQNIYQQAKLSAVRAKQQENLR